MVVLGLVLVLLALLLGTALIVGASGPQAAAQDVDIQLFDAVTINLDPLTLVIAGMVVMFLLWLGLVLIRTTLARRARRRRERKVSELEARDRREREEAEAAERARYEEGERRLEERRVADERRRADETAAAGTADTADTAGTAASAGPGEPTRPLPRQSSADETSTTAHERSTDATRPIRRGE